MQSRQFSRGLKAGKCGGADGMFVFVQIVISGTTDSACVIIEGNEIFTGVGRNSGHAIVCMKGCRLT